MNDLNIDIKKQIIFNKISKLSLIPIYIDKKI